ncbi:YncE family protein [Kitasatospora sp. NPDC001159]
MTSASRAAFFLAASLGAGAAALAVTSGVQARASDVAPPSAVAATSVSIPVSGHDRVYTADQTSNTVTVIDPSTNTTLGTIALGDQRLSSTLSPQYLGDVDVHGLAISPDHHRLAVVSVTSATVDIIDTATNKVVSRTDAGRAAHEGSFTADGKQFWVADRGRDTVTVVDAVHGGVITDLHVGQGPSKVVMSPDGNRAPTGGAATQPAPAAPVNTAAALPRVSAQPPAPGAPHRGSDIGRALLGVSGALAAATVLAVAGLRRRGKGGTAPAAGTASAIHPPTG